MQLWTRLGHSYYIINGLYLLIYFGYSLNGYVTIEMLNWEWSQILFNMKSSGSIVLTLLALFLVKYYKSCSAEQFLRSYFNLAKVTIFARCLVFNTTQAFLHLAVFAILYQFLQQPSYLGKPQKMKVIRNMDQYEDAVLKYEKRKKKHDPSVLTFRNTNMQFVEFYREHQQLSNDARAMWAGFAERYSTKKFRFYSVNVDKVPEAALLYDINIKPESAELPTTILFEEGVLRLRFPVEDGNTFLGKQLKAFRKKAFEKYFGFHNRWFDTKEEDEEDNSAIEETKKSDELKKKD